MRAKSLQSCLALCNPMVCSTPTPLLIGFSRQEYWSRLPCPRCGELPNSGIEPASQADSLPLNHQGSLSPFVKGKVEVKSLRCVQLLATPWTVAYQVSPSMGFSRQEYWNGLLFLSPGDIPNQGSNLGLLHCRQMLYPLSQQGSPIKKNSTESSYIP